MSWIVALALALLLSCSGGGDNPDLAKPSTCHGNNSACTPAPPPPPPSSPGMATLLWDAVQASDLRGYRIYYGFAPDALVNKVDVGNVVTYMLGPFQLGLTLYAVITAIDTSGNESGPSNEASKVIS